uniref:Uncharacterized protein n=1 Tax=Setaria italica TaxID=4555 RepID=K3YZY9_SETIT
MGYRGLCNAVCWCALGLPLLTAHPSSVRPLTFPSAADHDASGSTSGGADFHAHATALRGPLGEWLRSRARSDSGDGEGTGRVAAVISDFCWWTQLLAAEAGVPQLVFAPSGVLATAAATRRSLSRPLLPSTAAFSVASRGESGGPHLERGRTERRSALGGGGHGGADAHRRGGPAPPRLVRSPSSAGERLGKRSSIVREKTWETKRWGGENGKLTWAVQLIGYQTRPYPGTGNCLNPHAIASKEKAHEKVDIPTREPFLAFHAR